MNNGFYFLRFDSYNEHGPYRTWAEAYDAGLDATFYSTDFMIQHWVGGDMVREWRDVTKH